MYVTPVPIALRMSGARCKAVLTQAAPGSEQFAVGFSLSNLPEVVHFVARQQELAQIHKFLYGQDHRSVVVLHGLGGIGKTQLAIAYTRQNKAKYTAIFWLNANDRDSLTLRFLSIAKQILRSQPSAGMLASVDLDGNPEKVVEAAKLWLGV